MQIMKYRWIISHRPCTLDIILDPLTSTKSEKWAKLFSQTKPRAYMKGHTSNIYSLCYCTKVPGKPSNVHRVYYTCTKRVDDLYMYLHVLLMSIGWSGSLFKTSWGIAQTAESLNLCVMLSDFYQLLCWIKNIYLFHYVHLYVYIVYQFLFLTECPTYKL